MRESPADWGRNDGPSNTSSCAPLIHAPSLCTAYTPILIDTRLLTPSAAYSYTPSLSLLLPFAPFKLALTSIPRSLLPICFPSLIPSQPTTTP